jgi:hypothetical protein
MVVKTAAASSNKPQPNPWEALISSATRARPTRPILLTTAFSGESDDGGTSSSVSSSAGGGGGYTILLQHSLTPKSQRKWALESTMAAVDKSSNSSSNINNGTRSNKSNNTAQSSSSLRSRSGGGGDWYGISGPFLVRQALYDLSAKCNGRVVFVSVAGTTGILDLDAPQDDNNDASSSSSSSLHLFRQNGAFVDLSSNPFGWNDEDNNEDNTNCNNNSFMTNATMTNLQSLASAIRQAVGLLRRIKAGVD